MTNYLVSLSRSAFLSVDGIAANLQAPRFLSVKV
jgi:hypothetical protein